MPDPTPSFVAGQYVTVFRSRLSATAGDEYAAVADEMRARAGAVPGFVDFKTFTADDGERVSLITFDGPNSHAQWRDDVRHREAQRIGRDRFYDAYSIQVCECRRAYKFERAGRPPAQ